MKGSVARIKSVKPAPSPVRQTELFPIVGIGASAGGLDAFSDFLRTLPAKTGMAFVLVQHLDPSHSSGLHTILARVTRLPLLEVTDGMAVQPDHVYVIPPNTSMILKGGVLRLSPRVLTRGQHLPIDHFLRSLAEERGDRAISVILSGTASDGTEGTRAIKAAGGTTFAQDEKSAKYHSMPHNAIMAGCVDFVLSPQGISKKLTRPGKRRHLAPQPLKKNGLKTPAGTDLATLLSLLRLAVGVDFTHYKQTTLRRRIERRMALHKMETLKDYVRYVQKTRGEVEELYQDMLIHVTGFFRDPGAFEALRKHVFPALFRINAPGTVRVWVPGCSSGEEVYSLAMAMLEYLWLETTKTAKPGLGTTPFQIFATDISDSSLDRARAGLYSDGLVAGVSPERLRRFFTKVDGGYQIVKPVREMCIFAKQNVAKDPPFSNLDLISCRNLLIYLGPVLQRRVIPTLHYALKPKRFLMLGGAESLGASSDYFLPLDRKNNIYQKKSSAARLAPYFTSEYGTRGIEVLATARDPEPASSLEKKLDQLLLSRFAPASIVVNEQMEIARFRGKTGDYLEPPAGQPTFNLTRMARPGLLVDLRAALAKAKKTNATVRKEGVAIRSNGETRRVNLEVCPLPGLRPADNFYVIVFQEASPVPSMDGKGKTGTSKDPSGVSRENAHLRRELAQMRDQCQTLIEEHATIAEDSTAAKEEVLSANEELQSTNEELETAKEELQSANEELTTLNEELQNRNAELTLTNNDLLNVLSSVSAPLVIVSDALDIRRFTPQVQKLLNLRPADIGRRLSEIRPNLVVKDLGEVARESIQSGTPLHLEVQEEESGVWHLMSVRPYKTWDNRIDGAVLTFQNIDAMKRSFEQMHLHADALIEAAREAILVLDGGLRVLSANLAFYRNFEVSREETQNRPIYDLGNGQWNIPKLRELLENILPNNGRVEDFEVSHNFPHLGPRRMMLNARRIEPQAGQKLILLYIEDITT